ncbi:MAG TPA: exonuclease SbcCD subunit D [Glaciihabitans sp.]|jgi:exonuclease SbcD|nr:exonuclease SbcCD subunit D [Glaciihabitans sp.]
MKILHTSDWHIGRTFHGHPTLAALREVLSALVTVVAENSVDVVVVSGDIFDSATPAAENYTVLTSVLRDIRATGAVVVMTSGNHDSATRLGFQSEFAELAGIHIVTRHEQSTVPITVQDEHGPVHFFGIPFLEPALIRHHYPEVELRTHSQVLTFVMTRIRSELADRPGRSIVLSHCFAVGVAESSSDVERDITAGGLDFVPLGAFDGPDYVALGHIHGRAQLSDRVRYSGAPLHYSFSEADKVRGAWLVTLDKNGLSSTEWVDLPVPRPLAVVTGELEELLDSEQYAKHEDEWVSAILTDRVRPLDGMRRLQARFPFCVSLEHRPAEIDDRAPGTYRERIKLKSDHEIVGGFLEHVRNGVGPNQYESELIAEILAEQTSREGNK